MLPWTLNAPDIPVDAGNRAGEWSFLSEPRRTR